VFIIVISSIDDVSAAELESMGVMVDVDFNFSIPYNVSRLRQNSNLRSNIVGK